MDNNAIFKLTYGLYLLSTNSEGKDNGCIINTVMQVTDNPKRIAIAVNKMNLTHDMISKSGIFNVSVLDKSVPFSLFERFGFKSGRDADKFDGFSEVERSINSVLHLTKFANAFICARVVEKQEFDTHTMFIGEIEDMQVISDLPSVSYEYYHENIKPKPQKTNKKGFICKICGFVYEGETLPSDYVCPICKHGAEDFEPIE